MNPDEQTHEAPDIESFLEALDAPEEEPAETPPAAEVQPPEPQAPASPPEPNPSSDPAPTEDQRVSEGLKALMARERELQEARRQLEEERARLEPLRKYETLHRKLEEEDAEGALQELGIQLDALNQAVVEGRGVVQGGKAHKALQSKLEEIQKQIDERIKRVEQLEIQRLQQETVAEVQSHLTPDRYPLAAAVGDFAVQAVLSKAQEHFKRDNRVPDYSQVIGEIERELGEFADKLMQSEAVRSRYLSQQPSGEAPARAPSVTLTNEAASQVSKRKPPTQELDLSLLDDREAAIEALLAE